MEHFVAILFLMFLGIPISAAVRLVVALASERVRRSIRQHPIAHAVWFIVAAVVVILSLLLPPLNKARWRSAAALGYSRVANQLDAVNPAMAPRFQVAGQWRGVTDPRRSLERP